MIKTNFCLFPWEINCSKTLGNWEGGRLFSSRCCLGVAALCLLPKFPSSLFNILDRKGVVWGCSPRWPTLLAAKWHHEAQCVLSNSYEPPASRGPDTLLQALQCWIPGPPHRKGLLLMTNRHWTGPSLWPHPSSMVLASVEPASRSSGGPGDAPSRTLVCRLTTGYSQVGSGNLGKWEEWPQNSKGALGSYTKDVSRRRWWLLPPACPRISTNLPKRENVQRKGCKKISALSCQWPSFIFFGKTGSGAYLSLSCCLVDKSYPTLYDPEDFSLPGSSIHGIFHARKLQWVAMSFSKGSGSIGRWVLYHWAHLESHSWSSGLIKPHHHSPSTTRQAKGEKKKITFFLLS